MPITNKPCLIWQVTFLVCSNLQSKGSPVHVVMLLVWSKGNTCLDLVALDQYLGSTVPCGIGYTHHLTKLIKTHRPPFKTFYSLFLGLLKVWPVEVLVECKQASGKCRPQERTSHFSSLLEIITPQLNHVPWRGRERGWGGRAMAALGINTSIFLGPLYPRSSHSHGQGSWGVSAQVNRRRANHF